MTIEDYNLDWEWEHVEEDMEKCTVKCTRCNMITTLNNINAPCNWEHRWYRKKCDHCDKIFFCEENCAIWRGGSEKTGTDCYKRQKSCECQECFEKRGC